MKEYKRLFDLPYYQKTVTPLDTCLASKVEKDGKKEWVRYSTDDLIDWMNRVSKALMDLGVKADDKIALVSNNRPEWNFTDLGMQQIGAVNVPVYPTISESEYKFIFNDAEVKFCFVSDADLYRKIKSIQPDVPSLQEIFTFDQVKGAKNWHEILPGSLPEADLKAIAKRSGPIKGEDLATIIYTSGTTGNPKGVMLTHANLVSNLKAVSSILPLHSAGRSLSFLPLCHSFERTVSYCYLANFISIYYAESMDTIGENLKEVKPHYFSTVPRLLEKVYEKIMTTGYSLTGFKKTLFFWAVEVGSRYQLNTKQGFWYDLQLAIARKLIFSKWQEALGGNVEAIVTGAAAMQPRLGTLFTGAGIPVVEGYGMTETSPVITVNRLDEENRAIGTVGIPLPEVEVKIADDGEILVKGPNVMKGYYKRPDLTAETIIDGWMHTGDIGTWVDGKFLKITDRKKELFKTSGGKYVAPQPLENKYKEIPLVEQIMVLGENQKFVSALIVPSFPALEDWCQKNNIPFGSRESIVQHPAFLAALEKEIEKKGVDINKVEQLKKFLVLPDEWSVQTGELTPTLKLKRRVLFEKYAKEIAEIYAA
jgi:long-chain acyl-CoA synthetase